MNRCSLAARLAAVVVAAHMLAHECAGRIVITQFPSTNPPLYSAIPGSGPNTWIITLNPHSTNPSTSFCIGRSTSNEVVIIEELTIVRPSNSARTIFVDVGSSSCSSHTRVDEIQSIQTSRSFTGGHVWILPT